MSRPAVQQFAGFDRTSLKWSPVPLLPQMKECWHKGWPERDFTESYFEADYNIGLKSANGLVVSDLDCAEAVAAGDAFLPSTGAVYGRPSKRRSKRLYQCAELQQSRKFKDLDGGMLLELRVGEQDMAPPSVHPNGERLKWEAPLPGPDAATTVARELLETAHRHLATVALIARHWPPHGRHNLRLALARVLLETLGIPDDAAVKILEWACRLGGSDDKGVADVAKAVRGTRAKLDADEPATGAETVAALLPNEGRALLARLRKFFDKNDAVGERIEDLNERFAIVSVGPKVVVMESWPDGGIKELWSFDEFRRLLIKERVPVGDSEKKKSRPLADVWLQDKRGRRYDRLVYAMPGSAEQRRSEDYNGWLGFTVSPAPGDWSKNRKHLLNVICRANPEHCQWLLNWLAALVQWPGRHAMTAVVLRGGQGTGKGHFAHRMVGALFHKQQYLHIIGAESLTGRFNEHLSGKVLVFADESTWGGDPRAVDKLKGMVTESTVPIERKFLPLVEEPSPLCQDS